MKLRSEVTFKRKNSSVKEEKALGMRWIVTRDLHVGCAYWLRKCFRSLQFPALLCLELELELIVLFDYLSE